MSVENGSGEVFNRYRIKILIPAFNAGQTIAATLESLCLAPSSYMSRIEEIVVADDGSTDDTVAVASATAARLAIRLRLIRNPANRGERTTTNEALTDLTDGADWVLLLHADDLARSGWIPQFVDAIDLVPAEIGSISSSWDTIRGDEVFPGENDSSRPWVVIEGTPASVRGTLLKGTWWHLSGCAIRLRTFVRAGGFDPSMPQLGDQDWLLRILALSWGVAYIPRSLVGYRIHEASVSAASFRVDRDLHEMRIVFARYGWSLSCRDLIFKYFQVISFVVRRLLRSVTQRDFRSCRSRVGLAMQLFADLSRAVLLGPERPRPTLLP